MRNGQRKKGIDAFVFPHCTDTWTSEMNNSSLRSRVYWKCECCKDSDRYSCDSSFFYSCVRCIEDRRVVEEEEGTFTAEIISNIGDRAKVI